MDQPLVRGVGQLTVRLPFRPGPNIDPSGVSEVIGSGVALADALGSGLAAGDNAGEGDASTEGLGETVGEGLGDGLGEGLGAAAFVTLITNRLWHDCEPQPVMVVLRITLLPARPDVSTSRVDGSCDSDTCPGSMVQSALIRRGSTRRLLQVYCNFSVVFPSAISVGIPKTLHLPGTCTGGRGICCLRCKANDAATIRAVFVSSGPDCIAVPGSVASLEPRSISAEFVFVGRKL